MGGLGSGRSSAMKRVTTDQVIQIDIHYMNKEGLLKPEASGILRWACRGKPCGSVRYSNDDGYLALSYQLIAGDQQQLINQRIAFDYTPCHFGGQRSWFLCPECGKRVAILYNCNAEFLCRHCWELGYTSQQSKDEDRLIDQKHKLGARIFERYEGGKGYGKKKGMHWKRYRRLHRKYETLERTWCKTVMKYLGGD